VRWGSSCGPRTLFVSDLDFTLLRSDATLSARTTDVVNQLVAAGHRFTVATARSFTSTARVTAGLRLSLPFITYGGAVLADPHDGTAFAVRAVHPDSIAAIVSLTAAHASLEPLLFALLDGHDRVCWRAPHANGYIQSFAADRPDDPRLLPLPDWSALDDAAVFYVTLIGAEQEVLELHRQLAPWLPDCFITVGPDGYRPTQWWLEVTSRQATKAATARRLQRQLGADAVVAFGDNLNDVPLFEIADHGCAVANAVPELVAVASEVIPSNDDDGVARWLDRHVLAQSAVP